MENTLFPALKETLRLEELSSKKSREQIARAFVAKSTYNFETTRDFIDRLHIDRTLRIICGWRYKNDIPSEATFSRAFGELSDTDVAQKAHEKFYDLQDAGYDAD